MQANQRKTMDTARTELNQMLVDLAQTEASKVLETINEKLGNSSAIDEQRQLYATMDPIEIVHDLMKTCQGLCPGTSIRFQLEIGRILLFLLDYSVFRKLFHALNIIAKDTMLRNIFQIALCHGRLAQSEPSVPAVAEVSRPARASNKKIYFSSSSSSDSSSDEAMETTRESPVEASVILPARTRPSEEEMLRGFKEQLGSLQTLTFAHLSRIEQRLCEHYGVRHFEELDHGTLLKFIEQHERSLFSDQTRFHLASSSAKESCPTIAREELERFLLQAREKQFDQPSIEPLTCYHFQVQSVEELGYGTFRSIWNSLEENRKSINSDVHYECLVVDELTLVKQAEQSIRAGKEKCC